MEMQLHGSFVLSLPLHLRESSFIFIDNVNLCENNIIQFFEIVKDNRLPNY